MSFLQIFVFKLFSLFCKYFIFLDRDTPEVIAQRMRDQMGVAGIKPHHHSDEEKLIIANHNRDLRM